MADVHNSVDARTEVSLWVKLVSSGDILGSGPNNGPSGGASLQASR